MGFFDDIFGQPFGGMFDMNGDGKTDLGEEWLGYMVINECMKEEKENADDYSFSSGSGLLYDSLEDDSLDEFADEEASANLDWRLYCEDGSDYGIDPDDYDTEEDYLEALAEAKLIHADLPNYDYSSQEVVASIPLKLSFEITYPGKEQLEAINEDVFPNKRSYRAAYGLCELEHGNPYIPSESSPEAEAERFNFILSGSCIAAKYLTTFDGFLYAQAIKENFNLPITFEDEDEESTVWFPEVFMELAEENPKLAVDVWAWCIKEFGPYKKYMKNDRILYNHLLSDVDEYPPEVRIYAAEKLITDIDFCRGLLSQNPEMPCGIVSFITAALTANKTKDAQVLFTAVILNPVLKSRDVENFINYIISDCSNWEELETMENFKHYIIPIVRKMNDKRIQRVLPKMLEEVDHYIRSVESSEEKYQYTRRFSWRTRYTNSEYDVDPLDYETEDEYNKAVLEEKYRWRRWHSEAKRYGLDVNTYETEAEYSEALAQKRAEEQETRQKEQEERRRERASISTDPLAETDKAVYNFCAVFFQSTRQPYSYLTGDLDIKIGDKVLVPVGSDGKEVIATVVSTSQHMRITAPYPVDKARKVIKKLDD